MNTILNPILVDLIRHYRILIYPLLIILLVPFGWLGLCAAPILYLSIKHLFSISRAGNLKDAYHRHNLVPKNILAVPTSGYIVKAYRALPYIHTLLSLLALLVSISTIDDWLSAAILAVLLGELFSQLYISWHIIIHSRNTYISGVFLNALELLLGNANLGSYHMSEHHRFDRMSSKDIVDNSLTDLYRANRGEGLYLFLSRLLVRDFSNLRPVSFCIMLIIPVYILAINYMVAPAMVFAVLYSYFMYNIINYIQHYGLGHGVAWEYPSRGTLFNLSFHNDHHLKPNGEYYLARFSPESPQLPYGLNKMVFTSLVPNRWFELMNPLLDQYKNE